MPKEAPAPRTAADVEPQKLDALTPLVLGTAKNFRWTALIEESARYESDFTKAACTYRYRNAQNNEDLIQSATAASAKSAAKSAARRRGVAQATDSEDGDAAVSSNGQGTGLQAAIISELTRTMSTRLTATTKTETSGVERKFRWQGLKAPAKTTETADESAQLVPDPRDSALGRPASDKPRVTRTTVYAPLEQKMPHYKFVSAGLAYRSLQIGSWVAVVFQGKLWVGIGA